MKLSAGLIAILIVVAPLSLVGCDGCGVDPDRNGNLEQARRLYAEGEPREALTTALSLAEDPPLDQDDRVALAYFLSRLGASKRAVEVLDAWSGDLGNEGREVLARALLRSGSIARAMTLLGQLAGERGGSSRTRKLLGMAACGRRDWAEAVRLLDSSRIADPSDPECWAWLGWARVGSGELERGLRLLREGLRKFPESWEMRSMLSAVLLRSNSDEEFVLREVVTLLEWVSVHHPFDPVSRARLGATFGRLGRHARSEEVMLDLVSDYPSLVNYRIDLGVAQVRGGRALKAVRTFEDALSFAPRDQRLLLNLGLAYLEASTLTHDAAEFAEKSKVTFKKVVGMDAGCVDALIGMARATLRPAPGEYTRVSEAIGYYLAALKADPVSFPANLNVALLYYDLTISSEHAVAVRDDWFQKAMKHFQAAERVVDVSEWDLGARNAFKELKNR